MAATLHREPIHRPRAGLRWAGRGRRPYAQTVGETWRPSVPSNAEPRAICRFVPALPNGMRGNHSKDERMFNVLRAWLMPALLYLARLKDRMNQADQATKLNQIADAIATAKVNTAALKQEIADLQAAILVAGNSTPDIDAAFARIDAELSA